MGWSPALTAYLPVMSSPAPNFPALSGESSPYPKTSCTSWQVALPEATSDVAIRPSLFVAARAMRVRRDRAVAIPASQDPGRLETVIGHGVWDSKSYCRNFRTRAGIPGGGEDARALLQATNLWKTRHQQCCRLLSNVAANRMERKRSMSVPQRPRSVSVSGVTACVFFGRTGPFQLDSALKVSQGVTPSLLPRQSASRLSLIWFWYAFEEAIGKEQEPSEVSGQAQDTNSLPRTIACADCRDFSSVELANSLSVSMAVREGTSMDGRRLTSFWFTRHEMRRNLSLSDFPVNFRHQFREPLSRHRGNA